MYSWLELVASLVACCATLFQLVWVILGSFRGNFSWLVRLSDPIDTSTG